MSTAEILSMIKIFLPKGLSARVRNAIVRRFQSVMAGRSEAEEMPAEESVPAEIPPHEVEQAGEELQELPIPPAEEKEDDLGLHGNFQWSSLASQGDRPRERSRSPVKGASLPTEVSQVPVGEGSMPSGGLDVTPEQAAVLKEARENPKTALEVLHACT